MYFINQCSSLESSSISHLRLKLDVQMAERVIGVQDNKSDRHHAYLGIYDARFMDFLPGVVSETTNQILIEKCQRNNYPYTSSPSLIPGNWLGIGAPLFTLLHELAIPLRVCNTQEYWKYRKLNPSIDNYEELQDRYAYFRSILQFYFDLLQQALSPHPYLKFEVYFKNGDKTMRWMVYFGSIKSAYLEDTMNRSDVSFLADHLQRPYSLAVFHDQQAPVEVSETPRQMRDNYLCRIAFHGYYVHPVEHLLDLPSAPCQFTRQGWMDYLTALSHTELKDLPFETIKNDAPESIFPAHHDIPPSFNPDDANAIDHWTDISWRAMRNLPRHQLQLWEKLGELNLEAVPGDVITHSGRDMALYTMPTNKRLTTTQFNNGREFLAYFFSPLMAFITSLPPDEIVMIRVALRAERKYYLIRISRTHSVTQEVIDPGDALISLYEIPDIDRVLPINPRRGHELREPYCSVFSNVWDDIYLYSGYKRYNRLIFDRLPTRNTNVKELKGEVLRIDDHSIQALGSNYRNVYWGRWYQCLTQTFEGVDTYSEVFASTTRVTSAYTVRFSTFAPLSHPHDQLAYYLPDGNFSADNKGLAPIWDYALYPLGSYPPRPKPNRRTIFIGNAERPPVAIPFTSEDAFRVELPFGTGSGLLPEKYSYNMIYTLLKIYWNVKLDSESIFSPQKPKKGEDGELIPVSLIPMTKTRGALTIEDEDTEDYEEHISNRDQEIVLRYV